MNIFDKYLGIMPTSCYTKIYPGYINTTVEFEERNCSELMDKIQEFLNETKNGTQLDNETYFRGQVKESTGYRYCNTKVKGDIIVFRDFHVARLPYVCKMKVVYGGVEGE